MMWEMIGMGDRGSLTDVLGDAVGVLAPFGEIFD